MAFPTSLDSFTNPVSTDYLNSPAHATQHGSANDAIAALETKVGIDSSAVATSIDYLLKNSSSADPGHTHTAASLPTSTNTSARVYSSAATSLVDATYTAVSFDSESFDSGTYHDNSTNNSRLTIATTGIYYIHGVIEFASSNTTGFRISAIRSGGSTYLAYGQNAEGDSDFNQRMTVSVIASLTAAGYVELMGYQNSGGAINAIADSAKTWFEIFRIS